MAPSANAHAGEIHMSKSRQVNGYMDKSMTFSSSRSTTSTRHTQDGSHGPEIAVLQDATQKSIRTYSAELGGEIQMFLDSCASVENFFDFVAGIRLIQMPHHGSRWDKVLKWAEYFAGQVDNCTEEISQFASSSTQASKIMWASCRTLLEMGPQYIAVLEKIFGVLYSCSLTLGFFVRHHDLLHSFEELQIILATCYTDLLRLVTGITIYYSHKQLNVQFSARGFDERFGKNIDSFFANSDRFTDRLWATGLESLAEPGDVSVDLVRRFLTPHDSVTRILAINRRMRKARADFTCEWFDRHLNDFSKDTKNVFLVTGPAGSGKTILSEWVVERLQSYADNKSIEVMRYTIDCDLKTELSSIHVVKGLLLQMLQLNVGDNSLYKALAHAYGLYIRGSPSREIEDALWSALEKGLHEDQRQTIVIDGVDQLEGGEPQGLSLLNKLQSIVSRNLNTKCILFSRPFSKVETSKYAHFAIEKEDTMQDIQYFIESHMSSLPTFDTLTTKDKTTITGKLSSAAKGSFVWTSYAIEVLQTEKSPDAVLKRVETIPKALPELLDVIVSSLDLKSRDTKSLLAWLLAAERPLLLSEVTQLLEIDAGSCQHVPRPSRTEDDIIVACGSLVDLSNGFVRFTHDLVKQNIHQRATSVADFKNSGPFPFHIKEAHYDMTVRCLAYIKMTLSTRPTQPTLTPLDDEDLDELFNSYDLVQYATRYWAIHFEGSPMHEPNVQHKVTAGFKNCFPDSTLLALIEGSCFDYQFSIQNSTNLQLLTLSIRKLMFGEASAPVLQTILNLARTKQMSLRPNEPNNYYFDAWKLAKTLNMVSVAEPCATHYIEMTSHIPITKKSEVTIRRIDMITYLIQSYKTTRPRSKETLHFMSLLVTIYTTTGETELVTKWEKEIHEFTIVIYGQSSPVASQPRSPRPAVKTETTHEEIDHTIQTMSVTDTKRIDLTWKLIEMYEQQKDTRKVEEVLIHLWHGLSTLKNTHDDTVQEKKTVVALRYVEFLRKQQRSMEAEIILRAIYSDLETCNIKSVTVIKQSRVIGDQLQSLGAIEAARSIYQDLYEYYVETGDQHSVDAQAISTSLTQTTTEETHETITTREVWERTITSKTNKSVTQTTVNTATTLCENYYTEQRWTEIINIANSTLIKMWPSFGRDNVDSPLPNEFPVETLDLLNRLAFAFFKLRQLGPAEATYRRIFYSVIATPKSSDELLASSSKTLIDFYETHSLTTKVITVYKDLTQEIERRHGKSNPWTIRTLYTLGDVSMQINDVRKAEHAYRQIMMNLSQGTETCHKDAIRAGLALCVIYEQQHQFSLAQKTCNSIWQMFIKHGKEYDMKPDFAEDLYQRYVRIMKQSVESNYSQLRQLAVDYRKACVRFYGAINEATLKATLNLAEICEENEDYREEAITMYEEASQKTRDLPKGQVSDATMATIAAGKKHLPYLYTISTLSNSSRAIPLYTTEFEKLRKEKGRAHRDTLLWLGHLTTALAKQEDAESKAKSQKLLKDEMFEILKTSNNAQILSDSAVSLARLYQHAGFEREAINMMKQLRIHSVFGSSDLGMDSTMKLDSRTWVFIVAFESTVTNKRESFSSIMADLLAGSFLFQSYNRSVSQKEPFTVCLSHASRLLTFLRNTNDDLGLAKADKMVLDYFTTNLGVKKNFKSTVLHEFLAITLSNLQREDTEVSVLNISLALVKEHVIYKRFNEAHELAGYVDRFEQFYGGYNDLTKIDLGLRLATILTGRSSAPSTQTIQVPGQMLDLAGSIMKQILDQFRARHVLITDMAIEDLNNICGVLGDVKDLENLEWVLSNLWNARFSQSSWSPSVIVFVGRLLVETQFSRGQVEEATHLCEDMCYNLRRVWGPLDATTLEMRTLLASFYTSSGNHAKAMHIQEEILADLASERGAELPAFTACQVAIDQLKLLKRSYQRLGRWEKEPRVYFDIQQRLMHEFADQDAWKHANMQSMEHWQPKGADNLGVWTRPTQFEFMASVNTRQHSNQLRKTSGAWTVNTHSGERRSSRGHRAMPIMTSMD